MGIVIDLSIDQTFKELYDSLDIFDEDFDHRDKIVEAIDKGIIKWTDKVTDESYDKFLQIYDQKVEELKK